MGISDYEDDPNHTKLTMNLPQAMRPLLFLLLLSLVGGCSSTVDITRRVSLPSAKGVDLKSVEVKPFRDDE
ncbi:MAG: hypothetical protein HQL48_03805, partial [Gammaproteobacteria bacterium]|nr:hypothetical protein [Gammaproteobacteria bacterium]